MQLTVVHIGPKSAKSVQKLSFESLTRLYFDRIALHYPIQSEAFSTESAFLAWLAQPKQSGKAARLPAVAVLFDSRGQQLTSTEFAHWLGARRDQGAQHIVFAIGPADGWSQTARQLAQSPPARMLSFGPITMAHELARLVLAEQLYRACTILAGHPYHTGH